VKTILLHIEEAALAVLMSDLASKHICDSFASPADEFTFLVSRAIREGKGEITVCQKAPTTGKKRKEKQK